MTAKKKKTTTATTKSNDTELTEQLNRAYTAVVKNQIQVQELHREWRTHMLRLSYLVIVITLHQIQAPMKHCIKDIKRWNVLQKSSMADPMSGFQAIGAVLQDSMVELLSIICAAALSRCLSIPLPMDPTLIANRRPWSDFMTVSYRLSSICIPMIFGQYFNNKTLGCLSEENEQLLHQGDEGEDGNGFDAKNSRQFPIIFVFFTIVSVSLGFMQYQGRQQQKNVTDVLKLQHDLKTQLELKKKQ